MRNLLVLTCCLALAGVVRAEHDNDNDNHKGKGKGNKPAVTATTTNVVHGKSHQTLNTTGASGQNNLRLKTNTVNGVQANTQLNTDTTVHSGKFKKKDWSNNNTTIQSNNQVQSNVVQKNSKPWKFQKLTIQKNTNISPVHFNGGMKIQGASSWQGSHYNAFRLYTSQRHDRDWWRHNHSRIILVGGGYYYWDSGYWYPAWGYDPNYEFYAYDGPIYGYNGLPPDQVIANVQAVLQRDGYYQGMVDGMLGPLTRAALANYQRDHGLYITSAIDRPTLSSLGMS